MKNYNDLLDFVDYNFPPILAYIGGAVSFILLSLFCLIYLPVWWVLYLAHWSLVPKRFRTMNIYYNYSPDDRPPSIETSKVLPLYGKLLVEFPVPHLWKYTKEAVDNRTRLDYKIR